MQRDASSKWLSIYYDATLLFLVLDLLLGVDIRLSFLAGMPGWRAAYYAFCIACAALMHWRPDVRIMIGAVEGLITMLGLIVSMYLGYLLAGVKDTGEFVQVLLNYAISGYFAHLSWSRGMAALRSKTVDS